MYRHHANTWLAWQCMWHVSASLRSMANGVVGPGCRFSSLAQRNPRVSPPLSKAPPLPSACQYASLTKPARVPPALSPFLRVGCSYYYGKITRDRACDILLDEGFDGSFLLRMSTTQDGV